MNLKRFNFISFVDPEWKADRTPDPNHFYRRTFTRRYQAKKKALYYCWLGLLSTMILNPIPVYAVSASLFMTFFSFFVLDEVD